MYYRKQNTIEQTVTVSGFGYWSGLDVDVQFRPSAENTGINFVRSDLSGQPRISANIFNRSGSPRRTTIRENGQSIEMVEHILAALAGLKIDNCEIWVNAAEMPGCDGSSKAFVDALTKAGLREQSSERGRVVATDVIRIGDDANCWIQIEPADSFYLTYHLNYPNHPQIGKQTIELEITPDSFRSELATSRTFVLKQEAEWLLQKGLGKRVSYQHLLVFDEDGPIDNPLRFDNECVRHKALDVVGDFALASLDIVGHVTACRSGHRLNGELIKRILAHGRIEYGLDERKSALISKFAA